MCVPICSAPKLVDRERQDFACSQRDSTPVERTGKSMPFSASLSLTTRKALAMMSAFVTLNPMLSLRYLMLSFTAHHFIPQRAVCDHLPMSYQPPSSGDATRRVVARAAFKHQIRHASYAREPCGRYGCVRQPCHRSRMDVARFTRLRICWGGFIGGGGHPLVSAVG